MTKKTINDHLVERLCKGKAILAAEKSQPGYEAAKRKALAKEEREWRDNYLSEGREPGKP